jgi:hypothetical protein
VKTRLFLSVLSALGLVMLFPGASNAQEAGDLVLTVRAVPGVEGIRFWVGDTAYRTDEHGIATTTVPGPGTYPLRVASHALVGRGQRVEFVAWSDGAEAREREVTLTNPVELAAGFDVDYVVREQLHDADGDPIESRALDSITLAGDRETIKAPARTNGLQGPTALLWQRHPAGTRWLVGKRVELTDVGLVTRDVAYKFLRATAGEDHFEGASDPFYPARSSEWRITLQAYSVDIAAQPLLLGAGPETRISLIYPGGRRRVVDPSAEPTLLLEGGRYQARAAAGGVPLASAFALPGTERVAARVVGIWDVLVLLLGVAAAGGTAALVWRARPSRPVAAASGPVPARDLVRVELEDGRRIEGRSTSTSPSSGVMILSVEKVWDAAGPEVSATPSDSFILTSRITRIDHMGGVEENRQSRAEGSSPKRLGRPAS